MSDEKRTESTEDSRSTSSTEGTEKSRPAAASRARNQTVMLSPEMTGQVRALLTTDENGSQDPLSELLPPLSWDRPSQKNDPRVTRGNAPEGGDLVSENELAGASKRPTGKFRQGEKVSVPLQGAGAGAGAPAFSVNPSAARAPGASGSHHAVSASAARHIEARAPKTKVVGFMISFDKNTNGEVHEVRSGRWLLTSRGTEHGDFILIDDESISALHAIIRATDDGKIQVLDQLSEFGTGVLRVGATEEEEIAGSMTALNHGDRVRFGKRFFVVCLVPKFEKPSA